MNALDRIIATSFKSIKQLDLALRPLNVLIGANGAGKSNFISLFKLLNQIVEQNLQFYIGKAGGADTFLYFGRKTSSEISIELHFGQNGYNCTLAPTAEDSLIFADEVCWYHKPGHSRPFDVDLGSGHKETNLEKEAEKYPGRIASHVLEDIKSWKVYHFHDTSEDAKIKQTGDIADNQILRPDASNLAAFLFLLREKYREHYNNIVDAIRMVAPFFEDFVLRPSPMNNDKIRLEWKEKGSDAYFNAHTLSDGTLRFICLATLLLQPSLPSTILLDEPELGLHPYAITILAGLLRGAAKKTQVIASTQSVTLVNQLEPQDVIVVERQGSETIFKRLDQADMANWLDDYGLGDLWEKNILGGRP